MIAAVVAFALLAGVGLGYAWGRWFKADSDAAMLDRRLDEFRIQEQQRLLTEAREAHFRGELELAQMLEEAADRVITRGIRTHKIDNPHPE